MGSKNKLFILKDPIFAAVLQAEVVMLLGSVTGFLNERSDGKLRHLPLTHSRDEWRTCSTNNKKTRDVADSLQPFLRCVRSVLVCSRGGTAC